jgi:hypothetical protein
MIGASIIVYGLLFLILGYLEMDNFKNIYPIELTRAFVLTIVVMVPTLYYCSFLIGGFKSLKFEYKEVLMYMGMASFWGPVFEVVLNKLVFTFFGYPLWEYKIFPLHQGYTSGLMYCFWSLYGLHMYWLHQAVLRLGIKSQTVNAILVGVDAILIEILISIIFISTTGSYLFYYTPGDLAHMSTGLVVLPYMIFGYIGVLMLSTVSVLPYRHILGLFCFVLGYITLFIL